MLLAFLTMVTHWSRSSSYFHALIAQNLTREFTRKIYAFSRNVFSDSWSWQFCVILFLYKIKDSCYQDSFVIHGWFVYWVFWLRNAPLFQVIGNPFSDGIVFKNEPLPNLTGYVGGWGDSGLTWWPSGAASRLVSLSNNCIWCFFLPGNFMKSSVVFAASF